MLKVYKSSAGAGKTYTLALHYIDLLFSSPTSKGYKKILAVTFTKKATAEMKGRIIRELALLANGKDSNYTEYIKQHHNLNDTQLRKRAKTILTSLLQDYGSFFVTTIDSFFQQIIRSFARELDLPAAYNLELDNKYVVQMAVDDYFFNLPGDVTDVKLKMLLDVVKENLDNDKSGDIKKSVLDIGNQLLSESYQLHSAELQEVLSKPDLLRNYRQQLLAIRIDYLDKYRSLEEQMQTALLGADESIFQSGVLTPFHKKEKEIIDIISGKDLGKRFTAFVEDPLSQFVAKYKNDTAAQAAARRIHPLAVKLKTLLDSNSPSARNFVTASLILPNLSLLSVLQDLQLYIAEANKRLNRLPIGETNRLLYDVVSPEEESPFVYDKIGTRINHYMIDEFQDTSSMQWSNFYPLIWESVSHTPQGEDLLVGDVKQSIYRWRNSDYTTLQSGVKAKFPEAKDVPLDTNYRSDAQVVESNNLIFDLLASTAQSLYNAQTSLESTEITDIYSSVAQKSHHEEKGYVRIEFLPENNITDTALERLPGIISDLQNREVKLGKVAVLVRKNKDAKPVADCLVNAGFKVMSNEALLINQSAEVRLILDMLRLSVTPQDPTLQFLIASQYHYIQTGDINSAVSLALKNNNTIPQVPSATSLQQQVALIISTFRLDSKPSALPYLLAFQDYVYQYCKRYSSDPYSFLNWWDEKSENFAIQTPSDDDAVNILTIHKSKGLEFDAVIIPFCDWDAPMNSKSYNKDILWLKTQSKPFNTLPFVPVESSEKLLYTYMRTDFLDELCKLYIDNLNLTYVAFTRAKRELYVFAPALKEKKDKKTDNTDEKINNMGEMLHLSLLPEREDVVPELKDLVYERGEKVYGSREDDKPTDSVASLPLSAADIALGASLQVKLPSRDYLLRDSESNLRSGLSIGSLMHDILCQIICWGDEEQVIQSMLSSGRLTTDDLPLVNDELQRVKQLTASTDWFSPQWQVITEHDIVLPDGSVRRPDRLMLCGQQAVIVDWKFGQKQYPEYTQQVREYISLLQQMGYQATGFLCYANLELIAPVSVEP